MIQEHLRREVLYVEDLDVHPSEQNEVFALLDRLLGELITVFEIYVPPLFLVKFLKLFNIIGFVIHLFVHFRLVT